MLRKLITATYVLGTLCSVALVCLSIAGWLP